MRILLGDDHPLFREAIRLRLERTLASAEVVEASTLDEALAAARDAAFDLVLMDFNMPGMSPEGGIPRLREACPGAPIAIMSGVASPAEIRRSIEAGARGFLPKTMAPQLLSAALTVLIAGGSYLPTEILSAQPLGVPRQTGAELPSGSSLPSLTERERDVLQAVTRGLSNKQIGRELTLSEVTVKLHLRQIFRKTGTKSRAEVAVMASRAGFA